MLIAEKSKSANKAGRKIKFDITEPFGFADDSNVYEFELSNPVIGLDPMGLVDQPTTRPTTQPNDQNQAKWEVTGDIDLIVSLYAPDDKVNGAAQTKTLNDGLDAFAQRTGAKHVTVKNATDLAAEIKKRSDELTKKGSPRRKINVLVLQR